MRNKTPKSKGDIVVDVKPEDWLRAEEKWAVLKQSYNQLHYNYLQPFQIDLWAMVQKNTRSVVGEPVLIITNPEGNMYSNYPFPATILKAFESDGDLCLRVIYHPIEEETWTGERIEVVRLYQVMPLRDLPVASQAQKDSVQVALLLTKLNEVRNKELISLRKKKEGTVNSIESAKKDLIRYEKTLIALRDKLKGAEGDFLTVASLKEILVELSHHKKVDWAMFTRGGDLVIQTVMLYKIDRESNKEDLSEKMGRFCMLISPTHNTIQASNMDYRVNGHYHTNIARSSHDICLGDNEDDVISMIQSGKFYDLVDFMILFFSLHPHDGGDGGYESDWVDEKEDYKGNYGNPWAREPELYKISQDKSVTSRQTRRKGKDGIVTSVKKSVRKALPALSEDERKLKDNEKFMSLAGLKERIQDKFEMPF